MEGVLPRVQPGNEWISKKKAGEELRVEEGAGAVNKNKAGAMEPSGEGGKTSCKRWNGINHN